MEANKVGPMAKVEQIHKSFTYHKPMESQIPKYETLRETGKTLALKICDLVPPGREQSTAIAKLEEAIMWANKGIACGEAPATNA